MTFDRDLKETLEQMQKERAADQRYREAFDADLEFMMTPQVDLAAERGRPTLPPREVDRGPGIAAAEAYLASLFRKKMSALGKATLCMLGGWIALLVVIWLVGSLVEWLT